MNTIKKYKQFIAVIFVTLYAFVATPVQSWHHHNYYNTTSSTASERKDIASFSGYDDKATEENCQICSHEYSTYSNSTHIIFAAPLFIATAKEGFYYTTVPSFAPFNYSNKGPPALA